MFNEPHLTTFNQKQRKVQFVVVVVLIILLPILLYLLQQTLSLRGRAAPDASLRLVPRNIAKTANGTIKFTLGRPTPVDVVLKSGSNEVELVEVGIFYDPAKMSLKKQGGYGIDNLTCSQLTPLKNKVAALVAGLTIDASGNEIGTETGYASILCSAYNNAPANETYPTIPASFTGTVATFMFTPLETASSQELSIHFTPENPRVDSTILAYQGKCCSDVDVLQSVENVTFDIGLAQAVASLALSPSSGTFTQNETFDVQVNLSTGPHAIDSVDTIIEYDAGKLEAISISEGVIFPSYTKNPAPSGISIAGTKGTIEISAQINPTSTQGLTGDNLLFATVTFKALQVTHATDVIFKVDQAGGRNDSNIVLFKQGTDVLEEVTNAQYQLVSSQVAVTPTATPNLYPASLRLSPTEGNKALGIEFDVAIHLSTGGKLVDAAEAMLRYDKNFLKLQKVTYSDLFQEYENIPGTTAPSSEFLENTIAGFISANSPGINADDRLFATATFMPLAATDSTPVTLVHEVGNRNDSNVSLFQSSKDILGSVTNANYRLVGQGTGIIQRLLFKIALQGRQHTSSSLAKELKIRFIGTHFEGNPITAITNTAGEAELTDSLESRLVQGMHTILIKPHGYLQRKITTTINQADYTVDLTNIPFKSGDLDDSGQVNSLDWVIILSAWGTGHTDADIDGTGTVNSFDSTYMLINWFGEDEK